MKCNPFQYILDDTKARGLSYENVRYMAFDLACGRTICQLHPDMDHKTARRHMEFVVENFPALCQRMRIEPVTRDIEMKLDMRERLFYLKPATPKEYKINLLPLQKQTVSASIPM